MTPPIREAFVLTNPAEGVPTIARVPLLVRTILALERGGVERCTLVGVATPPRDARIRSTLTTAASLAPPRDDGLRVVVGADTVIDTALVRDLQARARPGEAFELEQDGARVRVAPGPLLTTNGGTRHRPTAGTLRPLAAGDLEQTLLSALENPRDGYLDRLLHRRLSRPLTRRLLGTPLTPNAVTVVGIALGVAGGLLLALPGPAAVVATVALLIASSVLDCVDGELARLCHAESRLGHWLDIVGDTVVHLALLVGIAGRIAATGDAPGWTVLGTLGVGVLGAFAVVTWSEASEDRRRAAGGWENWLLDRVLAPLSTRDWHLFPLAFALAGRLDALVPAAAVGANVFWLLALALLLRALSRPC
jgi:phosphatidylglycerophosphate synthase